MVSCVKDEQRDLTPNVVSIVIPCYNSLRFIEDAISSAYAQSYKFIEVIVVDDGSNDGSYELILELKSRKYHNLIISSHLDRNNFGVSTTRERGVSLASGEFIAFLDADDMFAPEKIGKQVEVMKCHEDVVLCHTGISVIGDVSQSIRYEQNFMNNPIVPYWFRKRSDYLLSNHICLSSVLVRTRPLREIPFATPQAFQYEDWLCWCLIGTRGKFVFIPERLTYYRVHEDSASTSIVRNQLKHHYSILEMKLALIVKSESLSHSLKCLMSAYLTLCELCICYFPAEMRLGFSKYENNSFITCYFTIVRLLKKCLALLLHHL